MKMHKIILTTETCGPVLFLGRTESEAIGSVIAYIAKVDWDGDYGTGWRAAKAEEPKPKHISISGINHWVGQLHEGGKLAKLESTPGRTRSWHEGHYAQHLADTSAPFVVYSQEEWESDEGNAQISEDWVYDKKSEELLPLKRAEDIVWKLSPILRLAKKEVSAAICTLMRSEVCRSRPGVLAGAAIRLATRFSAIEIHIVDIERALERLWRETGDADCRAAYQTIRERILLFTK